RLLTRKRQLSCVLKTLLKNKNLQFLLVPSSPIPCSNSFNSVSRLKVMLLHQQEKSLQSKHLRKIKTRFPKGKIITHHQSIKLKTTYQMIQMFSVIKEGYYELIQKS